jgi:hypothetical protein
MLVLLWNLLENLQSLTQFIVILQDRMQPDYCQDQQPLRTSFCTCVPGLGAQQHGDELDESLLCQQEDEHNYFLIWQGNEAIQKEQGYLQMVPRVLCSGITRCHGVADCTRT